MTQVKRVTQQKKHIKNKELDCPRIAHCVEAEHGLKYDTFIKQFKTLQYLSIKFLKICRSFRQLFGSWTDGVCTLFFMISNTYCYCAHSLQHKCLSSGAFFIEGVDVGRSKGVAPGGARLGIIGRWNFLSLILVLAFGVSTLSACTNQPSSTRTTGKTTNTKVTTTGTDDNTAAFNLSRVIKTSSNPNATLDLIGDGTGSLGQFCYSADGTTPGANEGPSTCQCVYNYTNNGAEETYAAETTYFESDLIRCGYETIPSTVTELTVSVHQVPTDLISNTLTFSMDGSSEVLDPSSPVSFVKISRHQCHDLIYIPSMFKYGSGSSQTKLMYDPFQSENLRLSYPLNFYSTNLGGAIWSMVFKSGSDTSLSKWECSTNTSNPANWENLNIYSTGQDTNGSKLIYPPSGSAFDRFTFYLAREKTAAFTVPIHAYLAPNLLSDSDTTTNKAPIGWGARTVKTSTGETCPSSATIPSGYHWVKVWSFKASLAPRKYVSSTQGINDVQAIACNPGRYETDLDGDGEPDPATYGMTDVERDKYSVFKDCEEGPAAPWTNPKSLFGEYDPALDPLVKRVLWNKKVCVRFPVNAAVSGVGNERAGQAEVAGALAGNPGVHAEGADLWERVGAIASSTADFMPFNLAPPDYEAPVNGKFESDEQSVPADDSSKLVYASDLDQQQSRYDYIFVVSPVTLMKSTMENKSSGYAPYYPYTFDTKDDCNNPDPDGDATCMQNKDRRRNYDLFSKPITSNPNSTDSDIYPICAVQPD